MYYQLSILIYFICLNDNYIDLLLLCKLFFIQIYLDYKGDCITLNSNPGFYITLIGYDFSGLLTKVVPCLWWHWQFWGILVKHSVGCLPSEMWQKILLSKSVFLITSYQGFITLNMSLLVMITLNIWLQ